MNTPTSNLSKRYNQNLPPNTRSPDGHYSFGLPSDYGEIIGHIIVQWSHLEETMILVLASLLGDIKESPARQIFRSLNSAQARLKVMRSLLQEAKANKTKPAYYDEVIAEFATLNKLRNAIVHGLWVTHATGRVFVSEATSDNDVPFLAKKPHSLRQLKNTLNRIIELNRRVKLQTRAVHSRATSPKKPAQRPSASGS